MFKIKKKSFYVLSRNWEKKTNNEMSTVLTGMWWANEEFDCEIEIVNFERNLIDDFLANWLEDE